MNRFVASILLFAFLLAPVGCSGSPPPVSKKGEGKKSETKQASTGTLVVDADKLPALAEAVEGLDDGRLSVRGPEGWRLQPRGKNYLVKFALSDKSAFPQVIVTGYDSPEPADLTEENAASYAEARQAELLNEVKKASIGQDFRPIKLPNATGVFYIRKGVIEEILVERVIITLIKGGHRYDVETRSVPANIQDFEKFGQAVANGLEWK